MKKALHFWLFLIILHAPDFLYPQNLVGDIIISQEENDGTGDAVAISDTGNRIIVGTSFGLFGQPDNIGYARVYQLINNKWEPLGQDLMEDVPGDDFGESVAISSDGNRAVVGGSKGAVVYDLVGTSWVQIGENLELPELSGQIENIRLSHDGNTIAISGFTSSTTDIIVYEYDDNKWQQKGGDLPVDAYRRFGLSDDGNRIAFYAKDPGSQFGREIRVFEYESNAWNLLGDIINIPNGYRWSEGLDLSGNGNRVICSLENDNGPENGAIAAFDFVDNKWIQTGLLGKTEIFTPYGVSLRTTQDGNTIVLGNANDQPANMTTVKVYQYIDEEWHVKGDTISNVANDETADGHVDITGDGSRFIMGGVRSGPTDFRGFIKVYDFGNPSSLLNSPDFITTNIYPNPTLDHINLEFKEAKKNLLIQLLNANGQILSKFQVSGLNYTIELPASPGLYILNIVAENGTQEAIRVLKQ